MGMDGGVRLDELRAAATSIGAAELDAARLGFHRADPSRSAKRTFYFTQIFGFALILAALGLAISYAPDLTWEIIRAAALTLFASAILLRLFAAGHLSPVLSRLADPPVCPTYTILCPLYREANVVADLVAALDRLDYPREALDIKLLVEGDDVDTLTAALAVAGAPHIEVIIIPAAAPRTKPKALNAGLLHARGEYVVVYDAEDRPNPAQLRAALAAFEDGPANLACVQAPLDIDNANASWIARQFAAEYAILFRGVLPLLARLRLPFPLGGSSNHFRIEALRAVGGWDPYNVSEDGRKFASNFDDLQRGTLHVPITSQCEKWSVKGLIGKGKARDTFNVREKYRAFATKNQSLMIERELASRSALISVGNCKKCAIGRHREAPINDAHRADGPLRSCEQCVRA